MDKGEMEYYIFPSLLQIIQDLSSLIDYVIIGYSFASILLFHRNKQCEV